MAGVIGRCYRTLLLTSRTGSRVTSWETLRVSRRSIAATPPWVITDNDWVALAGQPAGASTTTTMCVARSQRR